MPHIDGRFVEQARRDLTLDRLYSRLRYDPATGFFHKQPGAPGKGTPGQRMGCKAGHGRWTIEIDGKSYLAARLAWFYMTCEWPAAEIDHINQDFTDDRFCNLREATRSQNLINRLYSIRNKSGFRGVHKYGKRWIAQITSCGEKRHLGVFDTPEEAHQAYVNAARSRHEDFLPQTEIRT